MGGEPSNLRIAGVAVLLFSSVLLGVGMHHLVATGTCSSTGYSANYGPVPHCPKGTGWWIVFLMAGIFGGLAGAFMAGSLGLVFAGIFGGIGFGALSILFDSSAQSSTKLFGAIFGGCFAAVGVIAGIVAISSALGSLRSSSRTRPATTSSSSASSIAVNQSTAFGIPAKDEDPILSAYNASRSAPGRGQPTPVAPRTPSSADLLPGLQAAVRQATAKQDSSGDAVAELSKLSDLHQKGALTDAEFARAKAKLLGQI